jgi:hypothetical protein
MQKVKIWRVTKMDSKEYLAYLEGRTEGKQTKWAWIGVAFLVGMIVGWLWCDSHWTKNLDQDQGFQYSEQSGKIMLGIKDR